MRVRCLCVSVIADILKSAHSIVSNLYILIWLTLSSFWWMIAIPSLALVLLSLGMLTALYPFRQMAMPVVLSSCFIQVSVSAHKLMLLLISSPWSDWVLLTANLQLSRPQVKVFTTAVDTSFVHSMGIMFPLLRLTWFLLILYFSLTMAWMWWKDSCLLSLFCMVLDDFLF